MGGSASQPSLQILNPLTEGRLASNSPFWETIFAFDFPDSSLNYLNDYFTQIYQEHQKNVHLAFKMAIFKLGEVIKLLPENDNIPELVKTFKMALQLIRFILPVIVSHGNHINVLAQEIKKTKLINLLLRNLYKSLHMNHVTLADNTEFWYSNENSNQSLDLNRLFLVESLILTYAIGFKIEETPQMPMKTSAINMIRFYSKNGGKSIPYFYKLLNSTLVLLLQLNVSLELQAQDDTLGIFYMFTNDPNKFFYVEEYKTFLLPFSLHLLKIASNDNAIIDSAGLQLIINLLHILDRTTNQNLTHCALFSLASTVSFPSTCLSLNEPCPSFDSEVPVHRGSYADLLIEIVSRTSVNENLIKMASIALSAVIPYSTNLSYVSTISIFHMLETSFSMGDMTTTKMIIMSVYYSINRSIRENIPLVIILMKNLKLMVSIHKKEPSFEECEQLVSLIKNVNQELKQIGARFKSSELEKFFQDPACEHFALPVLRPPQIDFDYSSEFEIIIQELSTVYAFSHMKVIPKQQSD